MAEIETIGSSAPFVLTQKRTSFLTLAVVGAILVIGGLLGMATWVFVFAGFGLSALSLVGIQVISARSSAAAGQEDPEIDPSSGLSQAAARLVEKLPDPLLVLDGDGRILGSNKASHALIAGAKEGRHVSAAVRAPGVLDAVELVLRGGGPQTVEYTSLVPVERHFLAYVAPLELNTDQAGPDSSGALLVLRDLTAQKRVERMRADFVANASHELRTPLASLSGFIETLRGHAKDDLEARERFLEIMNEQAARMRRLIEDLLSLSRIELNEHVRPEAVVRVEEVVRDVVDGLIPQAEARNVQIDLSIKEPVFSVLGDRDELYQVVQNLLDNALKYGGDGGRVEIAVDSRQADGGRGGPATCIAVRDFGLGIEREHIPRLTERFYRVDVRHSRQKGGTGLGLAIVKHIVNRHRGWLAIESTLGEGANFMVFLPQATNERPFPRAIRDDSDSQKHDDNGRFGVSGAAAM